MKFATRKRNIFCKDSSEPYEISRSKIDLFLKCKRCFYLDRRLGVSQPSIPTFTLNNAVDELLKKEFDVYREKQEQHPIMKGTAFTPYQHKDLDTWRNAFKGIRYEDEVNNFIVYGGIDDIWIDKDGELSIADYKATSKNETPTLDEAWKISYKRQVEIYHWLFAKNGFKMSPKTFFVYANGLKSKAMFDNSLKFDLNLIEYIGKYDWVDQVLKEIKETLMSDEIPDEGKWCDLCKYRTAAGNSFKEHIMNTK